VEERAVIHEPAREVPVRAEVDVLVAGGGPGGVASAVAAARAGASVLLAEQYGCVGGMGTIGHVLTWSGSVAGGLFAELKERMKAADGITANGVGFDLEVTKRVMEAILTEAGVRLRYHTFVCRAVVEEGAVKGVVAESKSGREALLARRVIDATGDADVAADAGCPVEKGRRQDGLLQPASLMFRMAGVDTSRAPGIPSFESRVQLPAGDAHSLAREAVAAGTLPRNCEHVLIYFLPRPGQVLINMSNVTGIDGTSADDLTRAEVEGRRQLAPIVRFLREKVPGFAQAYLLDSGALIGIRETRRVTGDYTLTMEDVLAARTFPDGVVRARFPVDIHDPKGHAGDSSRRPPGYYEIPYRCLLPRGVEKLLIAGRPISATHEAHASLRVMPICVGTGQAAGLAAALSLREGVTPRALDPALLRGELRQAGALV